MSSLVGPDEDLSSGKPPVPEHVQAAVRTLIEWAGDDPMREGLLDTPPSELPSTHKIDFVDTFVMLSAKTATLENQAFLAQVQ